LIPAARQLKSCAGRIPGVFMRQSGAKKAPAAPEIVGDDSQPDLQARLGQTEPAHAP
jgi:hypothetical protein